ncbi:acyl-CoA dehydrogenase [Algoriphagus sediminis]|uniref:Acyl-CoA dehydrogenase n=1 Tax=Algoriphagus sediminis TaxID=3057113 RepID=A0ABT7YB40_9BACT|nr:acyl-CoA dehydrogenase [Algoriphagus sediminis]MDN3203733.1 acyl-CoA dehydrogenase [Algoriphagus sediminis]
MANFYSPRDLNFQLFENIDLSKITDIPYFSDHSKENFELVLEAAKEIAERKLHPLLTEMDRKEPQLKDGSILIHPGMKEIVRQFGEDGWINATFSYDEGGQQLPWTIHLAAGYILQAANYSSSVFPFLTTGAANLIRSFGSKAQIDRFTPKMYSGQWQGTMALTEPDAGSSLSDLTTQAIPTEEEGTFLIKGQKIYISCGDHDACENVVHLLLARIKGAPAGTKGISLFIVPKLNPESGEPNDVTTEGLYHKMGYKGAPIAHLMFGSNEACKGYLVGEANHGLKYMFQMMNEARLGVGMNAVAIATAAFHASLAYAKERPQGRKLGEKNLSQPQVKIIEHADVKRMLLFQKSITEGTLALLIYCSWLSDQVTHDKDFETRKKRESLLDLLTPIAKSFPSEMGLQTTSAAVQVLGGAGYTTDFPVEQYYREARIHPIHEGTTGIHGLDLLGRKVIQNDGLGWKELMKEMQKDLIKAKSFPELKTQCVKFESAIQEVNTCLQKQLGKAQKGPEVFLADATLFLEVNGILCVSWMWLRQAATSIQALKNSSDKDFYQGKITTAEYFMEYELPKIQGLISRLNSETFPTIKMKESEF